MAGFPTNTAVALSNITIVGGAISNFVFNVGRRHAFFNRPLIDWNIILAMEPATILGALLGGYLNKVHITCHTSAWRAANHAQSQRMSLGFSVLLYY